MSSHDATSSTSGDKGFKKSPELYSLKIINPNNTGGELIINDLEMPEQPTSAEELKAKVCEQFSKYTEGYDTQFGYILPGHGMRGKQETVDTDEELPTMYERFQKRKHFLLWLKCKRRSTKRTVASDSSVEATCFPAQHDE